MMTLQHTLGILLLVYSVAVALPQERRRGRDYDEDLGLSSDVPGNSVENVPVKFGRTIYPSAWSTENTDSSDENNQDSTETRDTKQKPWSFSNALRLALNFVNKLKGRGSDYPAVERNDNENAPKSKITNESGDTYWPLFKKWLRRNKILKNDDTLSSYLLKHNSRFNDPKNYQKKPRRKYPKHFKSSANRNKPFGEGSNRKRNRKSRLNNKNKPFCHNCPKANYQKLTTEQDRSSKELSTLCTTKEYHSSSDENCDSSKLLNKKKDLESNDLIKINNRIEEKENVFTNQNLTSAKIVATFSPESIRKINKPLNVLKKHQNSKSVDQIDPETQTVSLDLLRSKKQRDPIKIQNEQVIKPTQSNKIQNSSQDPLMPSESQSKKNPKKNSENPQKTKKVAHTDSTIPPKSLNENTSNNFPLTKNDPQATKSQPKEKKTEKDISKDLKDPRKSSILTIPKNNFPKKTSTKEILKENQNDSPKIESAPNIPVNIYSSKSPDNKDPGNPKSLQVNGKHSPTPMPVNYSQRIKNIPSVPETRSASSAKPSRHPKLNSKSSQINKKNSQPILRKIPKDSKVTSKDLSGDENAEYPTNRSQIDKAPASEKVLKPTVLQDENNGSQALKPTEDFPPKKIPLTVSSTKPEIIKNIKRNSGVVPAINSSPQDADKIITKETSNGLPRAKNVSQTKKSPKSTSYETIPLIDPSSKPQSNKPQILKKNSKDPQMTEKDLKPAISVNNSFPQTTAETITKDLPVNKNAKMPLKNSPLQLSIENIKENSNAPLIPDSMAKEPFNISKHKPLTESIPKENEKNPKIDEQATSPDFVSPLSKEKPIFKKNIKPKEILTRPDETPLKKAVHQTDIPTENMSDESESDPNYLFPKYEDSSLISDEDFPTNGLSFFSIKPRYKHFGVKNSPFEDMEMDSYSGMDSDESDQESNENMDSASPSGRGNVKKSAALTDPDRANLSDLENVEKSDVPSMDDSSFKEPKEKYQLPNEKSLSSSTSVEKLPDKAVEDRTSETEEQREKFDTFLQYIYKNSNSSFFQSLRQYPDSF